MNESTSYIILPDLKLILELYTDQSSITSALELKKNEIKDKNYDSNFNFIISFTDLNASPSLADHEIQRYIDAIKSDKQILGNRKSAILTDKPNQVVIGTFYELAAKELPMNFKIFSSLEAALNWIGLSGEYESIVSDNIEYLKYKTT
jgi:hypothetical protein